MFSQHSIKLFCVQNTVSTANVGPCTTKTITVHKNTHQYYCVKQLDLRPIESMHHNHYWEEIGLLP